MITAIVSKKGGVGKTTTSVNLAAALAGMGRRVLLIDLDPIAGASLSLGISKEDLVPGVADFLVHNVPAGDLVRPTGVEGLSVIPASVDLRDFEMAVALGAEQRHGGQARRMYRLHSKDVVLRDRIEPLRDGFDFIFFDTPAGLDLLTRNAIAAADGIVIPTAPHFLAVEGLEPLIAAADRLGLATGYKAELLGVVLTMVDYRLMATRRVVDDVRRQFGRKVFAMEVRTNVSLAEAPAFGQTIYQYKPYATGARAYRLLAEEFSHLAESVVQRPGPAGKSQGRGKTTPPGRAESGP